MKKAAIVVCCLLSGVLLQGCIAAGALVVGGVAGGAAAADHRSFKTIASDEKIAYKINQKIRANDCLLKQAHIVVTSYNRVVLLAGQAPTQELKDQAAEIVKDVPNIDRVFNEITIETPTSLSRRSKDAAATTNVKARLMATTNVSSRQIKVVTENGTTYLMGITTRDQANAAAEVARCSTGVQRVVKLIQYINI